MSNGFEIDLGGVPAKLRDIGDPAHAGIDPLIV